MNIKDIARNSTNEKNSKIYNIFRGSLVAILITIISLLIFSILLTHTNISEKSIVPVITIITAVSILTGSILSVSKIENRGLFNGALVGLIYILAIYILSSIINKNFTINLNSLILISSAVISGMMGGIIGVNMNNKKR